MRIGILHAGSLLGHELAQRIAAALPAADLHLLTRNEAEAGTLTEAGSAAALLELADDESLARLDALVVAELHDEDPTVVLAALGARAHLLVVSPGRALASPPPLVAGVNDDALPDSRLLHSPHAVTVSLALLLAPLRALGPVRATITAILPASMSDRGGLDELMEQTKALLTFQSPLPQEHLGAQLAFNLLPGPDEDAAAIGPQLRTILGKGLETDVTLLRAGVFHGITMTATCTFAATATGQAVRERLAAAPMLAVSAPGDPASGALDAALHDEVQVTLLGSDQESHVHRFWIVADHLIRGGAANAVALLEAALAEVASPTN
jgi:aspartate-semialdehyde dehydrogenase